MTIMYAGKKICKLLDIKEESVTDLSFTTHHTYGKTCHTGLLMKTKDGGCVIVPDVKNVEKLFIYSEWNLGCIVHDLYQHYTQHQIAGLLKISQSTVCRILEDKR